MSSLGRVGITRPAGRGQHLVAELSGLGLESVEVPLVEIRLIDDVEPLRSALATVPPPSLVVLSSASAVPALLAVIGSAPGIAVAAVGPATKAALESEGIPVTVEGDGSGGVALAGIIGPPLAPGDRAVLLAAAGGRHELAESLVAFGWKVEPIVAYETVARPPTLSEVEALGACDVVCYASPSAVTAFEALRDSTGAPLHRHPAAVIGATTAGAARQAGFVVVVATEATDAALAEAAAAALRLTHEP